GASDRTFARRLRQLLRDNPVAANEQMNGNGASIFFQLQKVPIYDDAYVQVQVGAAVYPIVEDRALVTANNCFLDFDSGLLLFGVPPPVGAGNITIQKQKVRWSTS